MKNFKQGTALIMRTTRAFAGPLMALTLIVAYPLYAGTTSNTVPISGLFDPQGADSPRASGDYVVAATGLNSFYRYYVEVPSGLTRLVVQLFDADIGDGAGDEAANRDRGRDAGFTSTNTYRLFDPNGVLRATMESDAAAAVDNAWASLFDSNTAPAFVGVNTNTANTGTTLAVTIPAGNVGDQLIASAALNSTTTVNTPTGWTLLDGGNCGAGCHLAVFSRTAQTGDASVTFTWGGSAQAAIGSVLRYTASNGVIVDGAATGNTNAPTAPSVVNVANSRVVRLYTAADNTFNTQPATARFGLDLDGPGAADLSSAGSDATVAAAGGTGTAAFDLDGAGLVQWRAVTVAFANSASPNGHWEVQVDPQTDDGDDINAIGVRAHDGNSDGTGTEIPVYYDSHTQYGTNDDAGAASTRAYDVFPWITAGCTFGESDFDFDNGTPTGLGPAGAEHGRIELVRPTSTDLDDVAPAPVDVFPDPDTVHQQIASNTLSGNDVWNTETIARWGNDSNSIHYGIWRADIQISEYSGNSNYSNVYFHNFESAGGAPAANPTTNAIRVYLRNDADGAPVKPYMEQFIRALGPTPITPDVGVTNTYAVTVRLVNPTATAITYSTPNNVVTIPLSGASQISYVGSSAAASLGSIVSQPADTANTGSVVWNPGSLAATSVADATFRVRITPTVANARILVTQAPDISPSLAGTRGQYVDETGNTSQTRATFLAGPICELAVTENLATRALVLDMRAVAGAGRQTLVEWKTSTEDGTAAFQLYRLGADKQWTAVGDWVVADARSAQGAVYRVADPGLVPGTQATYAVVERERGGKPQTYGPYTVGLNAMQAADPDVMPGRLGRVVSVAELDRLAETAAERMVEMAAIAREVSAAREGSLKTTLKITVGERGLTAVPAAQIATGFGMNETAIRARIENGTLRLETEGTAVSTFPGTDGAALYFYAEPKSDLYSREGVYWLSLGNGSPMGAGAVTPTLIAPATRFNETLTLETDAIAVLAVPTIPPDADYWFWDVVSGGGTAKDFTIALPDAAQVGNDGSITVRLRGATSVGVTGEHQVDVRLNGQLLGTETFTGNAEHVATFPVPHAVTATGQLVVSLSSQLPSGVPFSAQFVDGFDVSYARRHRGAGGSVEFDAAAGEQVAVAAFTGSGIALLDVTDAKHPKRLTGSRELPNRGGSWTVSFRNQLPARLLVARLADAADPLSIEPRSPADLVNLPGAEYVVIAPAALASEAADLAAYRAAQGLSSIAVSLDDIYDEFAFGYPRPAAIRDFLRAAYENWSTPPRFVVLAGEGTYDYRGLTGLGGNLVPARLIETPQGLFAADASYGDVDGDGVSEMSVGRLPVGSGSELASWLARLQAQESAPEGAAFRQRVIVASDTGSAIAGGDFKPPAEGFASRLNAPAELLPVHLSDLGTSAARSTLLAELNAGASALVYYGHAGLDRLADESILTSADVPAIANAGRSPLLIALTCSINRFELPGFSSLGEELVRSSTGGAIAVWSPSGLSGTTNANLLGDILASRLYASPTQRVGDVLLDVADRYVASGGAKDVLALYHLMGDPATIVNAPVAPEPPAGPPSSGE